MEPVKVAYFANEGGLLRVRECSSTCVAPICFEKSVNLEVTPSMLYEALVPMLGRRRGGLRWRSVKKAAKRRGGGYRIGNPDYSRG